MIRVIRVIRMIRGDKGDEDDKGDKEKSVYSSIAKPWTPPVYSRSKEGTRSNTPTCGEVGGLDIRVSPRMAIDGLFDFAVLCQ